MTTGSEGFTLTIGDLHQVVPMAFPDATVAKQLAARLKSGDEQALAVRISPLEDSDVEGHWRSDSVSITIQLDENDLEGHAMSVHFPTVAEADRFRKRLLAVGLLAGTIAIGSVSAAAIANQPISTGSAVPGTAPASVTYQAPAGRGFFEGADISVAPAAAGAAAEAAIGSGTRGGLVEGADIGMPAAAASGAAANAAAANAANAQTRGGLVEGADVDAGAFGIGSSVERAAVANAGNKGGLVEGADIDSGASGIGSSVERSRVGGVVEGAD